MSGEIKLKIDELKKALDPKVVAKQAYSVFLNATPKKTGNAQDNTILKGNVIEADYPYAQRLDLGWSKKKPQGMTKPTMKWFEEYVKKQGK